MLSMVPLTPETLPQENIFGIFLEVLYFSEIGLLGSYMVIGSYQKKILVKSQYMLERKARYYYELYKGEIIYIFRESFQGLPLLIKEGNSLRNELIKIRLGEGR